MPIVMHSDRRHRRVDARARGTVTYGEIREHLDREERARTVPFAELFDASGASTSVTADQVRDIVRRVNALLHGGAVGPTAIVATDPTFFGMARMYGLLAELDGITVGVFDDTRAAEDWLEARTPGPVRRHQRRPDPR